MMITLAIIFAVAVVMGRLSLVFVDSLPSKYVPARSRIHTPRLRDYPIRRY